MAEEASVKLTTPFGNIVANGFNVVLLAAMLGVFWIVFDTSKERQREHEQMLCLNKLQIWVYTQPRGASLQPVEMPPETWACVPEFMVRQQR